MNIWPSNFKVDSWWKVMIIMGMALMIIPFLSKITFVNPIDVFLLGLGLFLIGLSYFIARIYVNVFRPNGILQIEETLHNVLSRIVLLGGIILTIISISFIIINRFNQNKDMNIFNLLFGKEEEESLHVSQSRKENVEDFFKVNLDNIMGYNPTFTHSEINVVGFEVKHYNLRLKELELGLFYELDIAEVGEGEYNITFKGRNNSLTKELSDFLDFYTNKYGLDEMGCGKIEQSDYHYINSHLFNRMWKNLMIDNNSMNGSNGNIEMTILGIKTK